MSAKAKQLPRPVHDAVRLIRDHLRKHPEDGPSVSRGLGLVASKRKTAEVMRRAFAAGFRPDGEAQR